jgi:hypothetical protein
MSLLRPIAHPHIAPFLSGYKVTLTSAPAATLDIGKMSGAVARNAAGKATITLPEKTCREGVVIATPGADIASGAFATYDTDHSLSAIVAEMLSAAGSGDDGTMHVLTYSPFHDDTVRAVPTQNVKNSAASPRLLAFKVAAAGTISQGSTQAAIAKASSVSTLTFANHFGRAPVVVATPVHAAAKAVRVTAATAALASVETYDPVGTALEDNAFHCLVLGWDTPDEVGGLRRTIAVPQIAPRLEVFAIHGSGTAALSIGAKDGTLTDNGTGDYTITFAEAFKRAPVVVVCGKAGRAQLLAQPTTTACRIGVFNTSNAAADDDVYVMVLGYDSDAEV